MDLESLANAGEFIGGIAVVVSLVYLAIQIRQNTQYTRLQLQHMIKGDAIALRRAVIESPDFGDFLARAIVDFDSLSPGERIRFNMGCANVLEHQQQMFLLRDQLASDWDSQEQVIRGYFALEPFRRWWASGRAMLAREFVEYVETEILPSAEGGSVYWKP
jgi:hypothetical protein